MSRSFGDDALTFRGFTDGALDRNGIAARVPVEIEVENCRFRPMRADEEVGLTDLATMMWKGTAPPDAAVLAAKAVDEVEHNGITYQIVGGVKPYKNRLGVMTKVTVFCQKQTG